MKLFKTGSSDIVQDCRNMFGVKTVTDLVLDRKRKFLIKLVDYCDSQCRMRRCLWLGQGGA